MLYEGSLFKNKKFDVEKLKIFGFNLFNDDYVYKTKILNDSFELIVCINKKGIDTKLIESENGEEYNLIYVKGVQGEFVGKVKEAFESVLLKIEAQCTVDDFFKTEYAYKIIEYISKKYDSEPEYLWEKTPNNAVFRKKDNSKTGGKWFAAILTTKRSSLGLIGDEEIEVINLKGIPENNTKLIDNKKYFPAYHMNKKHWYTICLDGSVDIEEIKNNIDESYMCLVKLV